MVKLTLQRPLAWLLGVGLLISTVGAGKVWSYLRTAQHAVGESVRDAVPITFELQRLGQLTRDLIPEIQANRQQTLAAAVDKIRQYQRQHDVLVEKTEGLQGELKLAELAADAHQVDFDQSKLRQAKELAQEVEKRIRTVQKLVDGQAIAGEIPVEADSRPVTERFDSYFGRMAAKTK